MTKESFDAKIETLIDNMLPALRGKCSQLYRCGGIDTEAYPDNFELPKVIFVAALEYEVTQYDNGRSDFKREVKNLRHF